MAKVVKKLSDVKIGDVVTIVITVTAKHETDTEWTLSFSDGSFRTYDKATDPSIETGV